jgi:hypothetical protein
MENSGGITWFFLILANAASSGCIVRIGPQEGPMPVGWGKFPKDRA